MKSAHEELVRGNLTSHLEAIQRTVDSQINEVIKASKQILEVFLSGNKILICGNGGSAADSQHLAAEFVSSFQNGLARRALPAIALTTDSSILTAYSNDFDFSGIFGRQIEALGKSGDLLIVFSTSGKSRNCHLAIQAAKRKGLRTLTLSRKNSELGLQSEVSINVESEDTQRIQEVHMFIYHTLCEIVESEIMKREV